MASSATANLGLEKMAAGEKINTWGDPVLNQVIEAIDSAIAGFLTIALTADVALTATNFVPNQARSAMLKFTGTGPFTVTIPGRSKQYLVWNACTGPVTITTGAGTTVVVDPAAKMAVFCDGTNVTQPGFAGLGLKDYIDSVAMGATGSLPAFAGNAGKYLYSDGTAWAPRFPVTSDLVNITAYTTDREDFSVVMALIF